MVANAGYETLCLAKRAHLESALNAPSRFDEFVPVGKETMVDLAGVAKYLTKLRSHGGGFTTDSQRHSTAYLMNEGLRRRLSPDREPVFVYAHYNDPHQPYVPPLPYLREATADLDVSPAEATQIVLSIFDDMFAHVPTDEQLDERQQTVMEALYEANLAYIDDQVATIVEYVWETLDAVVVVTGDHGELLDERGVLAHRLTLDDAVTHVPLVVCGETDLLEYSGQIQHVDVIKTLLAERGINTDGLDGFDLRPDRREYAIVERGGERTEKTLDVLRDNRPGRGWDEFHRGHLVAHRNDRHRYEHSGSDERLYELPDETTAVIDESPDVLERFSTEYESFREQHPRRQSTRDEDLSSDAEDRLEELGYLVD